MSTKKVILKKTAKKTEKAAVTNEKNVKNVKENIKDREMKYVYPADVETKEEKKTFRRQARAKNSQFEKKVAKAEGKEQAAFSKEHKAWAKEVYSKTGMPEFA